MYLFKSFSNFYPIILHRRFEQSPGSTPESAHPPTPSATTNKFWDAYIASSPPLYAFAGCGIIWEPQSKAYLNFLEVENKKCKARFQSLLEIIRFNKQVITELKLLKQLSIIIKIMDQQKQLKSSDNLPPTLSALKQTFSYSELLQSNKKLQTLIESLNQKVQTVIEKHEGQFLLAYQNHIRKINYQLHEIKRKADQNEKQMKHESKLIFLEKQLVIFRDEALKLYDRLEEKTHEAEIYKLKAIDLEKTCYITQKQIRQSMKNKKTLEAKLTECDVRIKELEGQLFMKKEQIDKFTALPSQNNTRSIPTKKFSFRQGTKKLSINQSLLSHNKSKKERKFETMGFADNQLKQWFIQCLKSIKKDVAYRKHSGYQYNLEEIKNIDDFKMVDKLKLLEKFMQNQKLMIWMYEKIFPSRTDDIKQYLSVRKLTKTSDLIVNNNNQNTINYDDLVEISNLNIKETNNDESKQKQQEIMLPKMKEYRTHKSQIRNRVAIKQGKLSLSNI